MNFSKKAVLNAAAVLSFLSLTGCAPVIIGGGALVGALATRDKGVTGTVSDTQISAALQSRIYSHSSDLYAKIGMNVQNGEVLLTGSVPTAEWQADAERIAWEVNGVKQVLNQIQVSEGGGLTDMAKDAAITSQVKSRVLFDGGIRSLNYSIKTVGGVVYIMGDAQSQEELNLVSDHASKVSGVKKVISYARVKGEPAPE